MQKRVLFQHAYFVNDLDRSARRWAQAIGAGPFFMVRHHRTDQFSYRGTAVQSDVSYAFGYLGDLMIQLIEQHDERASIYRDMFARGQEGFHHIAYLVSDFAAERQHWLNLGYELATELYADQVNAAYFDTRALNGCFTEIHGDPPHILGWFALWRRTHEAWDGRGDPCIEIENMPSYKAVDLLPLK